MKKILFLTFYYEPDLCAGSFRNTPLVKELSRQSDSSDIQIDVITTKPNRYSSFSKDAPSEERNGNVRIERIDIPHHKSGITDQVFSFVKFYSRVKRRVNSRSYDLVYASSSRLFTAYLGSSIAKKKKIPLYLDIRDIFVDTIQDVVKNKAIVIPMKPFLKVVEKSTFTIATHINLISPGFEDYFKKYTSSQKTFYTHGIDSLFKEINQTTEQEKNSTDSVKILYAGNIGEGQGLHKIIPDVASALEDRVEFTIIGDGGRREIFEKELKNRNIKNVKLKKPVPRQQLVEEYKNSDYLFIHLNDYEAFKKVLPSKIFELGAVGKPLIAGVNGYARDFIIENLPDTILFHPGDSEELVQKFSSRLENLNKFKKPERTNFIQKFDREQINRKMAKSILNYL
ncbi:MAG: glycosyltransferase family 4 protein [Cyclobacteriaceae bacterium]|nr:glycosyltransferase family 4 protein [Cyclobacteriaceae bacterium]